MYSVTYATPFATAGESRAVSETSESVHSLVLLAASKAATPPLAVLANTRVPETAGAPTTEAFGDAVTKVDQTGASVLAFSAATDPSDWPTYTSPLPSEVAVS